jgi:hypothetical protein
MYIRNPTLYLSCENPNHKEYVRNFVKKYPTAKGNVPDETIIVDPRYWYISDNPKENTTRCCRVCSIQEDINRAINRKENETTRIQYLSLLNWLK